MVFQEDSQVGDFNGDGRVDIMGLVAVQVPGAYSVMQCEFWENAPGGFVDRSAEVPGLPISLASGGFVVDWDLDGDLDIACVLSFAGQVLLSNTYREAVSVTQPTLGGVFEVDFYAQPQHAMIVLLGSREANVPIPGFGRAFIDPAEALVIASLIYLVRDIQRVSLPIPNLPALVGMRLAMQGVGC